MIEYIRMALYASLIFIVFMLYQAWEKEHPQVVNTPTEAAATKTTNNYIPEISQINKTTTQTGATPVASTVAPQATPSNVIVHITTDVLKADIDVAGGNITKIELLKYPETLHSKNPVVLLNNSPESRYIAQSGLLSEAGPDTSKGQAVYTVEKNDYTLGNDQNELQIKLHWQNKAGVKVTKIFTFKRDQYEVDVAYQIENLSNQVWEGNTYLQLMRTNTPPVGSQGLMNLATYFGAAVSSPAKPFQKISFKEMNKNNFNETITGGWAAMVQHYFISAWVPDKNMPLQYFSRVTTDGLYTMGMIAPHITLKPGEKIETQNKFYAGPAVAQKLKKLSPSLELTIDYGWLWFISVIIFWMMQQIHSVVGNWGWSIVLVTVIIKLMFYHLSAKSFRSMGAMKKLQPKIAQLKERFGNDKQKLTQATLELYKKEKANPMSGCLPMLVQIPVFIALYWVLIESVELRQAPFILWIHDLSIKDPYYVLPILMGLSMFFQQRLNPPSPDPMQAKVMAFMPVFFTILFLNFPAGLMLYWFVNNTLTFLQQWYIMHSVEKTEKLKKVR